MQMRHVGAAALAGIITAICLVGGALAEDDYGTLLGNSFQFYQGQMSGVLPQWNQLLASKPGGWKRSAHLDDGAPLSKDLSGGFYDAGDYLKCPLPLGWAMANLAWSCLEFKPAYDAAGQWAVALNVTRWGTDWLMKAHLVASDTPSANVFVGQLADKEDHQYFGRPEHATNQRPVYTVTAATGGADVAAEYAAAFAAGAVLFRSANDSIYAATLFKRAQQAFAFAEAYKSNWETPVHVFQAYSTWAYNGYLAHLAFASAWMCRYSNLYCSTAEQYFSTAVQAGLQYSLGYDWDSTLPGAAVLLLSMNLQTSVARNYLENMLLARWQDTSNLCPKPSYSTVCYTPKGLAYYSDWGTLRNTGNMMFIAALMGKYSEAKKQQHICWARMQMRYILGSLPDTGKSYMIGYGPNQPQQPHHRQSACTAAYSTPCSPFNSGTCCAGEAGVGVGGCCDSANFFSNTPAITQIKGALVGGPDQFDVYPDIRTDYQRSEVAVDYNAGFTGATAGLAYYAATGQLTACGAGPATPNPSSPPGPVPPSPPPSSGSSSSSPSPAPVPPTAAGNCTATVQPWNKCGGMGDALSCPAELLKVKQCNDAAWQGYCCSSGYYCKRDNPYWWSCNPGPTTPAPQNPKQPSPSPSPSRASPSPGPLNPSPSPSRLNPSPSPRPDAPASPPGSCKAVEPWAQCGGKSGSCSSCTDAPWQGYCCGAGYKCKRDNEWWWMCALDSTAIRAAASPVVPGCKRQLPAWSACGGSSDCPADVTAAGKCNDAPWQGHCCAAGNACVRSSEYYYQCKPSLTANTKAFAAAMTAAAGTGADFAASAAISQGNNYDALVIQVPSFPLPARNSAVLAASLTRQGQPVKGSVIQFTITTTKKHSLRPNRQPITHTVTVEGVTTARGKAVVTIPRRAVGSAGDESVITAVTEGARARGVKGTVVLSTEDITLSWA